MILKTLLLLLLFGSALSSTRDIYPLSRFDTKKDYENESSFIKIAKCCETTDVLFDNVCTSIKYTNETQLWKPEFEAEDTYEGAKPVIINNYTLKIGLPRCQNHEKQWDVYYYENGADKLVLLPSGKLRHYISDQIDEVQRAREMYGLEFLDPEDIQAKSIHYDYPFGHYCVDKAILSRDKLVATYAMICVPEIKVKWENTDFLIKKAINPVFHIFSIICYIIISVVYFILPQLRDLVGNILTSMSLCLIVNQVASLVRIFTEFGNHINFMIADSVMYISLLAAFLWLNALGYYVWITFRSRNVFLRVTDTRKYCCYSTYVWGSTIAIAATALFAHFTLETNKPKVGGTSFEAQETLGWLGLSVLLISIAFTIAVDLSFIMSTEKRMKRMSDYGRIHHKMKYSFRMFVLIYGLMCLGWLSLIFTHLNYDGFLYFHIIVNSLQGILMLYVCVFGQKRVLFLLGKTCNCCTFAEHPEGLDWGEEMTAINAGY